MNPRAAGLLAVMASCLAAASPEPWNEGAAAAKQAIQRAANGIRVVHVVAHPDDEDAALLTALSRGLGYDVLLLSLSRGEGGANLTGPEMYEALGRIRTRETEAAARHYGVRLRFVGAVDFGFSKRLDETFEHWDRKRLLEQVVKILREEQPHIIIARFHGTERDGHGNHQAAGVIAAEAYRELKTVSKLFVSTRQNEPSTHSVATDFYDPLLGMTWRELATVGYRQHRTQGMGGIPGLRGGGTATLRLVDSRVRDDGRDLASGIDHRSAIPQDILARFDAQRPWLSVPALTQALGKTGEGRGKRLLEEAIARALCVRFNAMVESSWHPVPGQRFTTKLALTLEGEADARTRIVAPPEWQVEGTSVTVPSTEAAVGVSPVIAEALVRVQGAEVRVRRPLDLQQLHPVEGPQRTPLEIRPVVTLSVWPEVALRPSGATEHKAVVTARANAPAEGHLRVGEESIALKFLAPGEELVHEFTVRSPKDGAVLAEARVGKFASKAVQTVVTSDVRIPPGLRVGYVQGAGDETAAMLRHAGIAVQDLSADDLATGDLGRFNAILIGVRASAVRPDWKAHRTRLLDYAAQGGHVIVQYQTEEFDSAPFGPWPYKLTARSEEVSEENAPVRILIPDHPVFQRPNRIDASAFEGWKEQRGSKWMTEWDSRYEPLLESHDRGQKPQQGGLLVGRTGKGYWTYAAYAFYRQLPAGVTGAWKLLVNLLALNVI